MKINLENNSFISLEEREDEKILSIAVRKGDKLSVNSVSLNEEKWNELKKAFGSSITFPVAVGEPLQFKESPNNFDLDDLSFTGERKKELESE